MGYIQEWQHRNKIFDLKSYKVHFSSCLSAQMTIAEFEANGINRHIRAREKFQLGDDRRESRSVTCARERRQIKLIRSGV